MNAPIIREIRRRLPRPAVGSVQPVPEAPEGRNRRRGRFRLRNWPLRSKQIMVIVVPTLTALLLGHLRISTELAKADELGRAITQVDLSATVAELVHEIQTERDLVVGRVAFGKAGDRGAVVAQVDKVDRAVTRLLSVSGSIGDLDQEVQTLYVKVVARMDTLNAVRASAEQTLYPASDTLFVYEGVVGSLLQLAREITRVSDNRTISEQAGSIDAIANAKEQLAIQNSILRAAALSGSFGPGQLARLRSAQAEFTAELTDFQQAADAAARTRYANTVAGPEVDDRLRLQQIALNRGDAGAPVDIDVGELDVSARATVDKIRQVEIASLEDLRRAARDLSATARNNALRDAALIIVAVLVALLLMLVVARSLIYPLRVLRRDALDVANRRLPATVQRILSAPDPLMDSEHVTDPVPVFTTEEVGQVARSFDAVHDQAVRMATEQAMLRDNINSIFVNLSRRSQALVERQLALIDRLEQDEQDPDQLASLFELDHLATRMRRNSESLLVLSGSGLSRQHNRPVPASEVVGAAMSEVEQYVRIEVLSTPDVQVQGRAVSDLVHLTAELLDNATFFSEPEKKVIVRMAVTRKKELAIQITDSGVGMPEDEIDTANKRLADPPDLDVAVTRRMGLYVVARLAKKHNITVRLRDNEDIEGGLLARITVPDELITLPPTSTAPQPSLGTGPLDRPPGISSSYGGARTALFGDPRPASTSAPRAEAGALTMDAPTARLPKYQAVLSEWFAPAESPMADHVDAASWVSPGDVGWQAARSLLNGDGEDTAASSGLPRRVPKARLIPGSAAPRHGDQQGEGKPAAEPEREAVPRRSAPAVRSQMSSFQHGVRRGRRALTDEQSGAGEQQQRELE